MTSITSDQAESIIQEEPSSHDSNQSSNSPTRTFNPGEFPFLPEKLDQSHKPKVGDLISFFDDRQQCWVDAQITANLSSRWKNYYNILYENGQEDGLYLLPDTRWTFRTEPNNPQEKERHNTQEINSIKPSPEVSLKEGLSLDNNTNLLLPTRSDDTISETSGVPIHDLDLTRNDSLEWDLEGIELHSTTSEHIWPVDLHQVINLENLQPFPIYPNTSEAVSLNHVANLDNKLPLSSTPRPNNRLSQLRRQLPLEVAENRGFISTFFRRLNPFKQKTG